MLNGAEAPGEKLRARGSFISPKKVEEAHTRWAASVGRTGVGTLAIKGAAARGVFNGEATRHSIIIFLSG